MKGNKVSRGPVPSFQSQSDKNKPKKILPDNGLPAKPIPTSEQEQKDPKSTNHPKGGTKSDGVFPSFENILSNLPEDFPEVLKGTNEDSIISSCVRKNRVKTSNYQSMKEKNEDPKMTKDLTLDLSLAGVVLQNEMEGNPRPHSLTVMSIINALEEEKTLTAYSFEDEIKKARPFSTILLPGGPICLKKEVVIDKPLLLQGQMGTVIVVQDKITVRINEDCKAKGKIRIQEMKIIRKCPDLAQRERNISPGRSGTGIHNEESRENESSSQNQDVCLFHLYNADLELEDCILESFSQTMVKQEVYHKTLEKVSAVLSKNANQTEISEIKDLPRVDRLPFENGIFIEPGCSGELQMSSVLMKRFHTFINSKGDFKISLRQCHFECCFDSGIKLRNPRMFEAAKSQVEKCIKEAIRISFKESILQNELSLVKMHKFRVGCCKGPGVSIVGLGANQLIPVRVQISHSSFSFSEQSGLLLKNLSAEEILIESSEFKMNQGNGLQIENTNVKGGWSLPLFKTCSFLKNAQQSGVFIKKSMGHFDQCNFTQNQTGVLIFSEKTQSADATEIEPSNQETRNFATSSRRNLSHFLASDQQRENSFQVSHPHRLIFSKSQMLSNTKNGLTLKGELQGPVLLTECEVANNENAVLAEGTLRPDRKSEGSLVLRSCSLVQNRGFGLKVLSMNWEVFVFGGRILENEMGKIHCQRDEDYEKVHGVDGKKRKKKSDCEIF